MSQVKLEPQALKPEPVKDETRENAPLKYLESLAQCNVVHKRQEIKDEHNWYLIQVKIR